MTEHDRDQALAALLAAPPLVPDPAFAARTMALVEAEAAYRRARRAAWRRFLGEAVAAAAVAVGAVAVARYGGEAVLPSEPGLAAALALLLWLMTRREERALA
jgi:hypothetical protein